MGVRWSRYWHAPMDRRRSAIVRLIVAATALVVWAAVFGVSASGCAASPVDRLPYRTVEHSFGYFTCKGNGDEVLVISSMNDLEDLLRKLATECTGRSDSESLRLREALAGDLERAQVDLERDSLVLIQQVYGSGMITASLDLAMPSAGRVTITVTPRVPDGPLTPDLSIQSFAVAVDRTEVDEVEIIVDGRQRALLRFAGGGVVDESGILASREKVPSGNAP